MQFLGISKDTTLSDLRAITGSVNMDAILHINQIPRVTRVGKAFNELCEHVIDSAPDITYQDKMKLLNQYTKDSDIFETLCLMPESSWKLLKNLNTISGMIRIPDEFRITDGINIIGDGVQIANNIYKAAMNALSVPPHSVDPSIFNKYGTIGSSIIDQNFDTNAEVFQYFKIPWGEVSLYSSISDSLVDFPVYPESVSDSVHATYNTMPDLIYQYEPWQLYTGSGPRSNTYEFKFHRDMWTGNHNDGMANKLIRFCMANCYADYNGSAVNTPIVTLYIHGDPVISGVLTDVSVNWDGPLGHDGWYLVCSLSLSITEVSQESLNYYKMMSKPLIG